ncbi:MAG: tripartite tricarboxylate transporter substrate binding protein [Betaproteobacteria bacterium]|nr:tripartite tricarboxylate transporter substrate binding protein [Betaproteobacteria bacterium]MBI2510109.1 tripartite tricarboxylate transporter substrate binding protein [Betaproteobacteria bacterium]
MTVLKLTIAILCAVVASSAAAQNFPARPIRVVVPFAPGGNVDINARNIAPGLTELLGQPVVVDNRAGAGGTIGTDVVAKAPPDGHTLLVASSSIMTNGPALYPKLPYDIVRDFAPVGRIAVVPLAIVVHPSLPAKNTRELIAVAKAQGGNLLMANAGVGTTNHLIAELFMIRTGARMTLVPYKGSAPALIDLVAGHVYAHVDQISSALPYIKSGRIRAVAVTTARRAAALPEVPTLAESGVPGFDASTVTGLLAPSATPREIVARLNSALVKTLASPALKDRFAALGAEVQSSTGEELGAWIKEDLAKWVKVVKQAGIKLEL